MVYQNHKSHSFRVRRGVPQESVLSLVLFSLFINDLPASLPCSVSCSRCVDDLVIWFSYPSVHIAVEASQGALFRLERWSENWCLPFNPSKCEASFFSVDSHKVNLQPNLLLLDFRLRFNQGCGSGPFFVKAEARKFYRFRIGGKNGERKEIGSAILRRRAHRGSISIKKWERGEFVKRDVDLYVIRLEIE